MNNKKYSLKAIKLFASALHLFFLIVMFSGIALMYLNDNFGIGITRSQETPYEDTADFSSRFNQDLNDIFHFIEYNEIFATNGSIDISKNMLRMTFGPNETESFSLGQLITYLQELGYQLNDDFKCSGEPDPALSAKSPSGYVDWTAAEPNYVNTNMSAHLRRSTLEEMALEIMATLNRYYSTYNRLLLSDSNLHFKIEYIDYGKTSNKATVYTNDNTLTQETAKEYGKYAYLPGNSVFYDTNFKSIALNTISSLAANNPYNNNTYYLIVAMDTAYPNKDAYYYGKLSYEEMQNHYILGFVMMALGATIAVVTLILLALISGHANRNDSAITLHGFDETSTETGIIMFFLATLLALYICRYTLVRVAHLVFSEDSWDMAERTLYTAVIYLGALLLSFSLLRRYKARTIWSNSLVYKCSRKCSIFLTQQDFAGRLTISFFSYLAVNSILLSLVWFLLRKLYINRLMFKLLIGVLLIAWLALNLWIYYIMYRRSLERDKINAAVERLAAGETNYQVNLEEFEGKEQELAVNINNISVGLETALQEKVKSERLKADLITNVSHDIKTPLTSIINYVDLIKREQIGDEKILRYLDILEQKSQRLKTLTEDLVEASKASSGNLKLEISDIDFIELIYQTNGEFEEKFASRHLELVTTAPDETLIIEADGRRLWRVLENLYNNAFKYAMEGSRIYIDVIKSEAEVSEDGILTPERIVFIIKNVSSNPLNIRADELTERFVRGDVARTTEGSGLGLSIAKSLTELQKGLFEICIDGDLFKVKLAFEVKKSFEGNSHA